MAAEERAAATCAECGVGSLQAIGRNWRGWTVYACDKCGKRKAKQ